MKMWTTGALFLLVTMFAFEEVTSQQMASVSMDQMILLSMNSSKDMEMVMDGGDIKVELDMMYRTKDWESIMQAEMDAKSGRKKRKAVRRTSLRWSGNTIPYSIYGMSYDNRRQIDAAIRDWNRYTCVNFRQSRGERNNIRLQNGGGCSSYVGMIGGTQTVSLAPGCRRKGIIIHELGHALGLHHEQTRPDRDNYVRIQFGNIPRSVAYNFRKYSRTTINEYGVPYDYKSIMHYGQYAFSTNGQPTIRTVDPRHQRLIGNRYGLSFRDIKIVNLMYSCNSRCSRKLKCPGEGFQDKTCKCVCPGSPTKDCSGTGTGVTTTTTTTTGGKDCMDMHPNCAIWSMNKECEKNPGYMLVNCKMSCKSCNGKVTMPCKDGHKFCKYWQRRGFCSSSSRYSSYMAKNCRASCGTCHNDFIEFPPPVITTRKPTTTTTSKPCLERAKDSRWCRRKMSQGQCTTRARVYRRCDKTCGMVKCI